MSDTPNTQPTEVTEPTLDELVNSLFDSSDEPDVTPESNEPSDPPTDAPESMESVEEDVTTTEGGNVEQDASESTLREPAPKTEDTSNNQAPEEPKTPVQKRIDQLTGKFKEAEEKRTEAEKALEAKERQIQAYEAQLAQYDPTVGLQNFTTGGRSIYTLSDTEVNDLYERLVDRGDAATGYEVLKNYSEYKARLTKTLENKATLQQVKEALPEDRERVAWNKTFMDYEAAVPGLQEHRDAIITHIVTGVQNGTIEATRNKYLMYEDAVKSLGLHKTLQVPDDVSDNTEQKVPGSSGSSSRTVHASPTANKKKVYTKSEIAKMDAAALKDETVDDMWNAMFEGRILAK